MPRALPFIVLLAVALRAALLVLDLDAVAIPAYELSTTGNLAKIESEVDGGRPLHRYYDNCGARLVVGLGAAALYAAVDDSYRTLKLVPAALGIVALLLLWWLLDRHVGRRTANLAALLLAVVPPTLVRFSVIAMGSHFESLPFLFLVWLLFLETHARGVPRRWLAATGAAAGLAVFVSFGACVLLLVLAGQHVARRGPARTLSDLASAAGPGLLVGLLPLAWIHLRTAGRPARFLSEHLPGGAMAEAPVREKAWSYLTDVLPASPTFPDVGPVSGGVLDVLLLLVLAAAWCLALADLVRARSAPWTTGRAARVTALLHFPVFSILVLSTGFDFETYGAHTEVGRFRYLVPSYAFGVVVVAAAATGSGGARGLRRAIGAAAVGLGAAAPFVAAEGEARAGTGPYRGHALQYHARTVLATVSRDDATGRLEVPAEVFRDELRGFDASMRGEVLFGVGHLLALDAADAAAPVTAEALRAIVLVFPEADRLDVARGVGSHLRTRALGDEEATAALLRELHALDAGVAQHVAQGLALPFRSFLRRDVATVRARNASLGKVVPEVLRPAFARGLGVGAGRMLLRVGVPADSVVGWCAERSRAAPAAADDVWFGVGLAHADDDAPIGEDLLARVPAAHLPHLWTGYGAGLRHRLGEAGVRDRWDALRARTPPTDRVALERGLRQDRSSSAALPPAPR